MNKNTISQTTVYDNKKKCSIFTETQYYAMIKTCDNLELEWV